MAHVAACTISSNNYLGLTRVLVDSYREHHPGAPVFVCIVDRPAPSIPYAELGFIPVFAADLAIPSFANFAFRYDILELNTAVKPFFIKYLRDTYGLDRVFYFDPDIMIHDRLVGLERALEDHLAVLTPHLTRPLDNTFRPPERVIRMCGTYNLGFVGLRLDQRTAPFLDWWCQRLDRYCINDLPNGMFVDQSWMDLAPAYLESVAVVRDPIYNIAYWNLPHRRPARIGDHWEVDGRRAGFFHFSGVNIQALDAISKHQDRMDLLTRPELRPLFEGYRDRILANGQAALGLIPYHYDTFTGSTVRIPRFARIALQETDPSALRWPDPFDRSAPDSYFDWLVEPLDLPTGVLNRAVLFFWRERTDLVQAFPKVLDDDLRRYVDWLLNWQGAEQGGLDSALLANVSDRAAPTASPRRQPAAAGLKIGTIDLRDPGDGAAWLNERVSAPGDRPIITRLALHFHRAVPELARLYPEPLGADRQAYAYWMTLCAPPLFGLHPALVEPISATLPLKSRLGLAARRLLQHRAQATPAAVDQVVAALEAERRDSAASADPPPPEPAPAARPRLALGVNVVGYFDDAGHPDGLAAGSAAAIARLGLSAVAIPLERELPALMTCDRIRHEHGAPHAITLLHVAPAELEHAIELLPLGTRVGTRLVAYWTAADATAEARLLERPDEIWTPSMADRDALAATTSRPVLVVPPCVALPLGQPLALDLLGFRAGRRHLFVPTAGAGADHAERRAAVVLRQLHRSGGASVTLVVELAPTATVLAEVGADLALLALGRALSPSERQQVVRRCSGLLLTQAGWATETAALAAMAAGTPVLLAVAPLLADALDATTCHVVAVDGDDGDAVSAVATALGDNDDSRARTGRARERVARLYGVDAAALRFRTQIARLAPATRFAAAEPR